MMRGPVDYGLVARVRRGKGQGPVVACLTLAAILLASWRRLGEYFI